MWPAHVPITVVCPVNSQILLNLQPPKITKQSFPLILNTPQLGVCLLLQGEGDWISKHFQNLKPWCRDKSPIHSICLYYKYHRGVYIHERVTFVQHQPSHPVSLQPPPSHCRSAAQMIHQPMTRWSRGRSFLVTSAWIGSRCLSALRLQLSPSKTANDCWLTSNDAKFAWLNLSISVSVKSNPKNRHFAWWNHVQSPGSQASIKANQLSLAAVVGTSFQQSAGEVQNCHVSPTEMGIQWDLMGISHDLWIIAEIWWVLPKTQSMGKSEGLVDPHFLVIFHDRKGSEAF